MITILHGGCLLGPQKVIVIYVRPLCEMTWVVVTQLFWGAGFGIQMRLEGYSGCLYWAPIKDAYPMLSPKFIKRDLALISLKQKLAQTRWSLTTKGRTLFCKFIGMETCPALTRMWRSKKSFLLWWSQIYRSKYDEMSDLMFNAVVLCEQKSDALK